MKYKEKYNCSVARDFEKLTKDSFKLLDQLSQEGETDGEATAADIAEMGGKLTPRGVAEVGGLSAATRLREEGIRRAEYDSYSTATHEYVRNPKAAIAEALDARDPDAAARLVGSDPKLVHFALHYVFSKPKHSGGGHPPIWRAILVDLLEKAEALKRLWRENGMKVISDRSIGGPKPVAMRIVVAHAVGAEAPTLVQQLISFDKNLKSGHNKPDRRRRRPASSATKSY